jgi:hypothetical protein
VGGPAARALLGLGLAAYRHATTLRLADAEEEARAGSFTN